MTTATPDARARVPLALIGLNAFAMILIGAGVVGLAAPELAPALARPAVAWSLLGVGVLFDLYAVVGIVRAVRGAGVRSGR